MSRPKNSRPPTSPRRMGVKHHGKGKDFVITTPENVLKELGHRRRSKGGRADLRAGGEAHEARRGRGRRRGAGVGSEARRAHQRRKGHSPAHPDGKSKVYRKKAGTNGLLFDRKGRLVCLRTGAARRVTRIDRDGKLHRAHRQLRRQEVQPAQRPDHRLEGPHLLLRPALRQPRRHAASATRRATPSRASTASTPTAR